MISSLIELSAFHFIDAITLAISAFFDDAFRLIFQPPFIFITHFQPDEVFLFFIFAFSSFSLASMLRYFLFDFHFLYFDIFISSSLFALFFRLIFRLITPFAITLPLARFDADTLSAFAIIIDYFFAALLPFRRYQLHKIFAAFAHTEMLYREAVQPPECYDI